MFSVVIPLYNKEHTIDATVRSVLNQNYRNFELLIVDDGSTDGSLQIVQSIQDPRIKVLSKENGGVSSARNLGIVSAKCEYVAFLDADDLFESDYLEKMKDLINDFQDASVFGCQLRITGEVASSRGNFDDVPRGYVGDYFTASLESPLLTSSSIIVKKDCFDKVGFFNTNLKRGEDLEMWVRLAMNYTIAFEPGKLAVYQLDASNRACQSTPPLEHYYYNSKLIGMSKSKRTYFLKLANSTFRQMLRSRRYFSVIVLLIRYNVFSPGIIASIVRNHLFSVSEV